VGWVKSLPREVVIANVRMLARLGVDMRIPLLVASTMEDRVGPTIEDIQALAPEQYANRVKRGGTLNCFLDPAFKAAVRALGRKNLIIAGLTTDICCYHTTLGAKSEGYGVQVVADACGSMSALADQLTYDRLRAAGVAITGGNQVLTELYQDFGSPEGQRAMQINLEEVVARLAA
jgi:isochorismate hydrolase